MKKRTCSTVWKIVVLAAIGSSLAAMASAQDTQYAPREQQIPPPKCLTFHQAWEGGYTPCTTLMHEQWLADISHWRMERRIRIGYDPARYAMP